MANPSSVEAVGAMLSPVVMVTSCAIIANGFLTSYGSVNDRMRAMTKERLDLVAELGVRPGDSPDRRRCTERLSEIDHELPLLLRRHGLLHRAVLAVYSAVPIVVASMFLIALAVGAGQGWAGVVALVALLVATGIVIVALAYNAAAVRHSQDAITFEVSRVLAVAPTESNGS